MKFDEASSSLRSVGMDQPNNCWEGGTDAPVNILIVDDRPENLLALEAALSSAKYHLVSASSGEEALKLLLQQEFAVILLDVQMPGMDGFETARLIKTREQSMHIPIIFITAINKANEHVVQGYSIGAVDYIVKPFHPENLKLKIEGFVKIYKNHYQLKHQSELIWKGTFGIGQEPASAGTTAASQLAGQRKESELSNFLNSNAQTVTILESITDAFYAVDHNWRFTYVNQEAERRIGISRVELIGKSLWEVYYPPSHQTMYYFKQAVAAQSPMEFEAYLEESATWLEVRVYPSETGLSVYFSDITKRKQMETELKRSQEYFRQVFNFSPSLIALRALKDGRYIDVNQSWLKITGYQYEEIKGNSSNVLSICLESDKTKTGAWLDLQPVTNQRICYFTKHGEKREGFLSTEMIEIYGEKCILSVITDITERVQIEKELARLDQLNLVGQMAAGIAHEIRNPMTTVRGFLQMSKSNLPAGYIDLMIEELDRANQIISEFLALSKNKTNDLKQQNINEIIDSISPLLQAEAVLSNKHVELDLGECPELQLDEKEIRQLILNMVKNGLDEMDAGGTVTIKTSSDREEVILEIRDEGKGIKEEIIAKIGTPFFTTKEKGTGLGLAVCYSIANRHNAVIDINSNPHGTSFLVRFKIGGE